MLELIAVGAPEKPLLVMPIRAQIVASGRFNTERYGTRYKIELMKPVREREAAVEER